MEWKSRCRKMTTRPVMELPRTDNCKCGWKCRTVDMQIRVCVCVISYISYRIYVCVWCAYDPIWYAYMLYMHNLCLEIQNLLAFGIIGLYMIRTLTVLEVRVEVQIFGSPLKLWEGIKLSREIIGKRERSLGRGQRGVPETGAKEEQVVSLRGAGGECLLVGKPLRSLGSCSRTLEKPLQVYPLNDENLQWKRWKNLPF